MGDKATLMVLGAAPVSLDDKEIRRIPSAFFMGRRCGMADADVLQAMFRQVGAGALPSALLRQWAEEAGLRGPGAGRGRLGPPAGGPGQRLGSARRGIFWGRQRGQRFRRRRGSGGLRRPWRLGRRPRERRSGGGPRRPLREGLKALS